MPSPLEIFRGGVLAGRVALITSGGTGIYRGVARAYAQLGHSIATPSVAGV